MVYFQLFSLLLFLEVNVIIISYFDKYEKFEEILGDKLNDELVIIWEKIVWDCLE